MTANPPGPSLRLDTSKSRSASTDRRECTQKYTTKAARSVFYAVILSGGRSPKSKDPIVRSSFNRSTYAYATSYP